MSEHTIPVRPTCPLCGSPDLTVEQDKYWCACAYLPVKPVWEEVPCEIREPDELPVEPVCPRCGSDSVTCEAIAGWDPDTQRWVLEDTYDKYWCECAEDNIEPEWRTISEGETDAV